jgi:hypothetical protein
MAKTIKAKINHRTPADAIGNEAERNLENCLSQPVSANRKPDQGRGRSRQVHAVGRQDRQDHEHAKHTKGEHQGKTALRRASRCHSFVRCGDRAWKNLV